MRSFASALSFRKDSISLSIAEFDLATGFGMTNYRSGWDRRVSVQRKGKLRHPVRTDHGVLHRPRGYFLFVYLQYPEAGGSSVLSKEPRPRFRTPGRQSSRPLGRTVLFHRQPERASFLRQIVKPHHAPVHRHRLRRDPNVAAADAPIAQQTAGHEFGRIDPDGEADSLRRQNSRRVHSHDAASGIY